MSRAILASLVLLGLCCEAVQAQDSRIVKQPVMPRVCTILTANQADHDGSAALDTARIQTALDQCTQGQAVELAANNEKNRFQAGPLRLPGGISLMIDPEVTLYASTDAALFHKGTQSCGVNGEKGRNCRPFITIEDARGSGIYGSGVIDGQGGKLVQGKQESWWQMARRAQQENNEHNVPRLIEINRSQDITLYQVTLRNAANFHVTLNQVDGFTAWGIKIDTPANARNTDGIDPISSRNITIAHSFIRTGDDNIAIKGGKSGLVENVSILHNHFYSGHGMSIGSETNGGVRKILVQDLTMDGSTSGLRIKSDVSRGGMVEQVRYEDICLRNVKAPIDIDTHYNPKAQGNAIPQYREIQLDHVSSLTPGRIILRGYDAQHPLGIQFKQVAIAANSPQLVQYAEIQLEQRDIKIAEQNTLADALNFQTPVAADCQTKFLDFPAPEERNFRPQLRPDQAKQYAMSQVLRTTGVAGKEVVDPWDPVTQEIATPVKPDYLVDGNAKELANSKTQFTRIQAAINQAVLDARQLSAEKSKKSRLYIQVLPGFYHELIYVPASALPITLYSTESDARQTKIYASVHAALLGKSFSEKYAAQFVGVDRSIQDMYQAAKERNVVGTNGTAIAWIRADGFQIKNITIENSYNKDAVDIKTECPNSRCGATAGTAPVVVVHHQAVAMMVEGADKVQFENIRLHGFQDTLYLRSSAVAKTARSFFYRSYIEGNVDFIFGDTTAYFYRSEIKSLGDRATSYVLAPNTNVKTAYGFVFNECDFTNDGSANALAGQFYLGRQWFHTQKCTPYAGINQADYSCTLAGTDSYQAPRGSISKSVLETVGKAVILNSTIGRHIQRQHPWADWNKKGSLAYRPAQFTVSDYWRNLRDAGVDPVLHLGYDAKEESVTTSADIFLGEFNNVQQ